MEEEVDVEDEVDELEEDKEDEVELLCRRDCSMALAGGRERFFDFCRCAS